MSELPDMYIVKIDPNRTGYDYLCTDYRVNTDQVQYTPHTKLQEAEDTLKSVIEAFETILANINNQLTIEVFAKAGIKLIKEHQS